MVQKKSLGGVALTLPENAFAHYKFNETSGVTAFDELSGSRDMTGSVATMWSAFSRNGDRSIYSVDIANFFTMTTADGNLILNNNEFSVCGWCYTPDTNGINMVSKGSLGDLGKRVFRVDNTTPSRYLVGNQVGDWATTGYASSDLHPISTWHHTSWVFKTNPGELLVYIDGVLVYNPTYTSTGFIQEATQPFKTGSDFLDMGGYLNNLVLYDRALDIVEVNQVMNVT